MPEVLSEGVPLEDLMPKPAALKATRLVATIDGVAGTVTAGQIADLVVGSAPGALDTLEELAAALGNDENFAATVVSQLGLKANKADTDTPNLLSKTTPVDADSLSIWDSAALAFRKVTVANLIATLKTYFDTLYSTLTAASQAQQEAASSKAVAVTPGTQHFHPSAAKAFACVTQTGGVYTLQASSNVSSIVKNGTGDITINWTTPFSSGFYAVLTQSQEGNNFVVSIQATTAGFVRTAIRNPTGAAVDTGFSVACFGGL